MSHWWVVSLNQGLESVSESESESNVYIWKNLRIGIGIGIVFWEDWESVSESESFFGKVENRNRNRNRFFRFFKRFYWNRNRNRNRTYVFGKIWESVSVSESFFSKFENRYRNRNRFLKKLRIGIGIGIVFFVFSNDYKPWLRAYNVSVPNNENVLTFLVSFMNEKIKNCEKEVILWRKFGKQLHPWQRSMARALC